MDFEDFLKKNQKSNNKMAIQNHHYKQSKSYYSYDQARFDPNMFIDKIKNNKKFKIILVFILLVCTAIIIGIIAILYSLVSFVFSSVNSNGISGLLEEAINFLNNLWNDNK